MISQKDLQDRTRIGAAYVIAPFALVDGVYTTVPLGGAGAEKWRVGLNLTSTKDGLVIVTPGRYLWSVELAMREDPSYDLNWSVACDLGLSNGAGQTVPADLAQTPHGISFTDADQLGAGEVLHFGIEVDGHAATFYSLALFVQYLAAQL